jgi:hypothetical protein
VSTSDKGDETVNDLSDPTASIGKKCDTVDDCPKLTDSISGYDCMEGTCQMWIQDAESLLGGEVIGGCAGTEHGCCPESTTACVDSGCSNCGESLPGSECISVTPCFCTEGNKPEVDDGNGGCTCDGVCDDPCDNMCGENTSCNSGTGMCESECHSEPSPCCELGGAACGAIPGTEWSPAAKCVCGFDPWCCLVNWDSQCMLEATSDACGLMC